MMSSTLVTFTARDAKTRFGEVLDEALGHPVGITRHDRLTAYVVSRRDFDNLRNRVQELEDRLWLIQAEAARKEGYASDDEVAAFLRDARNSGNESKDDEAGAKSLPKP
ncbi:MAG: type II toxin-antitoxin system Phd/YefM family antitoxin [Paraburkholderia sp.]|uniref:type II toxin-antitoxin system prevent-host-death family antitoxin n=1 Tax=Paraburkholderia sp. TaxID=1926495 RepID=UPI0011F435A2|nr:type II toxin-antitoxin system prevent-host-death family antitoxin [Paraburkholderia sp.]TAM01936.1 MAG: type II toxin-antitoxin system Phd/YefM family antitoxin [Paraburkholderia sp.]TAM29633.1 MAG: type II toxin-antitoxin system Phd/YefM family antitoxin [Paraburkholderia sp.]